MNFGTIFWIFVTIISGLDIVQSVSSSIFGQSVHWRPLSDHSISLSYHLILEQNICTRANRNISTCSTMFEGHKKPAGYPIGYHWSCITGCVANSIITNSSEFHFTDIGKFGQIEYEAGIEVVTFNFDPADDLSNIRIGFQFQNGTRVIGLGEGHINMAIRNDTKRPNITPMLNVFPVYSIPRGCGMNVKLYPFDGDGDFVRCHWEKFPAQSSLEYKVVLNEDKCELDIPADTSYKVGDQLEMFLYAQDYSVHPVKFTGVSNDVTSGPFSRTPLKLMVHIGLDVNPSKCDSGPSFTDDGTLPPYFKRSYQLPFAYSLVKLPFKTRDLSDTIITSSPRYMHFDIIHNGSTVDEGVWHSNDFTDATMKGIHQACGLAYTQDGVPGESRCAVLMVNEPDECESNPCNRAPGGVCDNLFEYNTCTYPDDQLYNGGRWFNQCKSEIIVQEPDDNLGIKVGVPVGVSLLLLLIVVAVTVYIKRYMTEKLQNATVEPEQTGSGSPNSA